MLGKDMLVKLYEYNYWANHKIMQGAQNLTQEQLAEPTGYSRGSLFDTLLHILATEWVWTTTVETGVRPQGPFPRSDFPTLEKLSAFWLAEERRIMALIDRLTEAELAATMPVTFDDEQYEIVRWHMLVQPLTHSIHHRSEAAELLTRFGQSPGDIDFIFFV